MPERNFSQEEVFCLLASYLAFASQPFVLYITGELRPEKAEAKAMKCRSETPEERQERFQGLSQRQSARLQQETPEERQERFQDLSQRQSARLQQETPEERQGRHSTIVKRASETQNQLTFSYT